MTDPTANPNPTPDHPTLADQLDPGDTTAGDGTRLRHAQILEQGNVYVDQPDTGPARCRRIVHAVHFPDKTGVRFEDGTLRWFAPDAKVRVLLSDTGRPLL